MTQRTIRIFINKSFSKGVEQNYNTNKTNVYQIDDIWCLDIIDSKNYGVENNKGYRFVLVVTDNFSKFGWTVAIRNKNAITIKDFFGNIPISSKRKPNYIESDRGKEFYIKIFQNFLKIVNIKHSSGITSFRAVFEKRFNRTITDLLERPVFEKGESNWVNILPTITKQHNIPLHTSTKLTPIQASLKKNEVFAYKKLLDKRKKTKPKFQVNNLVRVVDLRKTFSKGDTTNCSYNLYKISQIINDTKPSYHSDNLKEKYNEALLKKTELTMKENKDVMKALNSN